MLADRSSVFPCDVVAFQFPCGWCVWSAVSGPPMWSCQSATWCHHYLILHCGPFGLGYSSPPVWSGRPLVLPCGPSVVSGPGTDCVMPSVGDELALTPPIGACPLDWLSERETRSLLGTLFAKQGISANRSAGFACSVSIYVEDW